MDSKTVITRGADTFLVSTVLLPSLAFAGYGPQWETMVFPCTADGTVTDWGGLFCKRYSSPTDAVRGHSEACDRFQP